MRPDGGTPPGRGSSRGLSARNLLDMRVALELRELDLGSKRSESALAAGQVAIESDGAAHAWSEVLWRDKGRKAAVVLSDGGKVQAIVDAGSEH